PPVWNATPEYTAAVTTPAIPEQVTETTTAIPPSAGPSMEPGSPAFLFVVAGILLGLTALVIAGMYFFKKR
ncbi:MAG: hypothetical protein LUO97_03215, partial [Methanomicrobiales archaeon]|nr:hypothetical protein [Methanomicrobiales archaeon]